METLFDFDVIRAMAAGGFTLAFDAMSAVTGPYAHEILEHAPRLRAGHGATRHAAGGFRPSSP